MKKTFLLCIMLVLIIALLCGCSSASNGPVEEGVNVTNESPEKGKPTDKDIEQSIIGAWEMEDENARMVYIFQEGGTGYAALFPMTYTVKDGVITVTIEAFGQTQTGSANYSLDGDTITIEKDGETNVMTRTEIPEEFKEKMGL